MAKAMNIKQTLVEKHRQEQEPVLDPLVDSKKLIDWMYFFH